MATFTISSRSWCVDSPCVGSRNWDYQGRHVQLREGWWPPCMASDVCAYFLTRERKGSLT